MSKIILTLIILLVGCAGINPLKEPPRPAPKEFSHGEIIVATQLLTKVFDNVMAPLSCVPDSDEAELLLRTIRPRMEVAQDDLESMLDNPGDVNELVESCHLNCTCEYIDELFREHLVSLTPEQKKKLNQKKMAKELNRCMSYAKEIFCQSELYKTLENEKSDFSFEQGM